MVADRLGSHPQVATLREVELKIFCERGGLVDLHDVLTRTYSPNRAVTVWQHFERMTDALIAGRYGQRSLAESATADRLASAFRRFRDTLLTEGFAAPVEEERFFGAVRQLADGLAEAAVRDAAEPGVESDARIFLEKTPHNLLFADLLSRSFPNAAFVHIMRDPRSIAFSLLAMRWGPDRLEAAAEWVACYCRAWLAAEARAAGLGLAVLRLYVEDISAAPEDHAERVCRHLDLSPMPELFRGADPATLSRWQAKAEAGQVELLHERLGGWAGHFGYDLAAIGIRPDGPSGRTEKHAKEAATA